MTYDSSSLLRRESLGHLIGPSLGKSVSPVPCFFVSPSHLPNLISHQDHGEYVAQNPTRRFARRESLLFGGLGIVDHFLIR